MFAKYVTLGRKPKEKAGLQTPPGPVCQNSAKNYPLDAASRARISAMAA